MAAGSFIASGTSIHLDEENIKVLPLEVKGEGVVTLSKSQG